MKSVLISVQPQWCEKITRIIGQNGTKPIYEKSVEIRKTRPKIDTPFKCYIYCTKPKGKYDYGLCIDRGVCGTLKIVGLLAKCNYEFAERNEMPILSGKVIGEFVCDYIVDCRDINMDNTCLSVTEWLNYTNGHKGIVWGWHISDLVIYDKPKELSEFATICVYDGTNPYKCDKCEYYYREDYEDGVYEECCCNNLKPLKRPPQSWCYVYPIEKGGV